VVGVRIGMAAAVVLLGAVVVPAGAWGASPPDVEVVHTAAGPVLADGDGDGDGDGMTLYVFVDDLLTSRPSACTGDCTNDWPPALVQGQVVVGPGVTGKIGTIRRADGQRQLTMDGRPLYRFVGDQRSGDTRGNGVGNLWWAMTPSGLSATTYPAPRSTYGTAGATTLTVVSTADGSVVADSRGEVLYAYVDDTATTSACTADWCMVDWPALRTQGTPTVAAGVGAPVAVINGADGLAQVTLGGHPLYTFAGDLHPGDVRGEGVGGDWFLVAPSGSLVRPHRAGSTG
jgi:predicted lipoprotein with Yx(FWY)xxD motif